MSEGDRDELKFLETLSHDLASEVSEDEAACEEALRLGPDANTAITRAHDAANRDIAEQRRARIAALGRAVPAVRTEGRYRDMPRAALLKLLEERQAAVEHRELIDVPDDDLRSLLEDLDAMKTDKDGDEE
jgi:hypothetical protein